MQLAFDGVEILMSFLVGGGEWLSLVFVYELFGMEVVSGEIFVYVKLGLSYLWFPDLFIPMLLIVRMDFW